MPELPLCLTCGFCCDGTMFREVKLQADERVPHAEEGASEFAQPCPQLKRDCKCKVYGTRPSACRAFSCAALTGLEDGTVTRADADATIAEVRARRAVVAKLVKAPTPGAAVVAARKLLAEGRATPELADAVQRLLRLVMLLSAEPR